MAIHMFIGNFDIAMQRRTDIADTSDITGSGRDIIDRQHIASSHFLKFLFQQITKRIVDQIIFIRTFIHGCLIRAFAGFTRTFDAVFCTFAQLLHISHGFPAEIIFH